MNNINSVKETNFIKDADGKSIAKLRSRSAYGEIRNSNGPNDHLKKEDKHVK